VISERGASVYNATMMYSIAAAFGWTTVTLLVVAALLHLFPRLGSAGRSFANWLCYAPGLDLLVTIFTVAPLIVCPIVWGWGGLIGGFLGQYAALILWTIAHEAAHWKLRAGPKIFKFNNRLIGTWQNLLAVFITSLAAPTFWVIRLTELTVTRASRR
jgi:hypothetical protein